MIAEAQENKWNYTWSFKAYTWNRGKYFYPLPKVSHMAKPSQEAHNEAHLKVEIGRQVKKIRGNHLRGSRLIIHT